MKRWMSVVLLLLMTVALTPASAAPEPRTMFESLWKYYDLPIYQGVRERSWTWGLTGKEHSAQFQELFQDAAGGHRAVAYFDKGRMEITDPAADPASSWYVTSGLLPIELLSGRMQLGYDSFEQRQPAAVAALGDPTSFPTYADLRSVYQSPGSVTGAAVGKPATCMLNRDGSVGTFSDYADDQKTRQLAAENGHTIAQAFRDFQTQIGPVYEGSNDYARKQVYNPSLVVFGLPVSEPCWAKTLIGGREQMVLFQIFERRVLTYNPANEPSFQVEMGNIGQHYYRWRYGAQPFATPSFAWDTFRYQPPTDPATVYTLEVVSTPTPDQKIPQVMTSFSLFVSRDGGATRELRYTQERGPCREAAATLVAPADAEAAPERIGLAFRCTTDPSAARGVGVTIYQSADGGRTFWAERGY